MYSLLVSHQVAEIHDGGLVVPSDRFLEYTGESFRTAVGSLSDEAIAYIGSWPCLLLQEGRAEESAHVARIREVRSGRDSIHVVVSSLRVDPPLVNDAIWRLRAELGIEQFEFSRNHWALKDGDLLATLAAAGHEVHGGAMAFACLPLPGPARAELMRARTAIGNWSHTEIDDLLLEAGVEGLDASRGVGSRRDRANAIIAFALENPSATTAENKLFSNFLVRSTEARPGSSGPLWGSAAIAPAPAAPTPQPSAARVPNRVLIVHGQDEGARAQVVDFLSALGLTAVVLHDQPNMGRHLLTKFIDEAELVTFAVVLMTADDLGGRTAEQLAPRARQNVILELGYFLSHLGQPRVCALVSPGLETPSDFDGIVYIRMDDDDRWQAELERELRAAAMPISQG